MVINSPTKFYIHRGKNMRNMKIKTITISLLAFFLLLGCYSMMKSTTLIGANLQEVAINLAIQDFSTKCDLFKKDSVFSVTFEDSVFYKAALIQVDKGKYKDGRTHKLKRGDLLDGIASVEIGGNGDYQFYYSEETKSKLPTRYVIKDGKLFYWWDKKCAVTEDIIAVLWRYNMLQTYSIIPNFSIDESQKGAHYYFCKNDLSKYKRVVTSIGLGYYKPPQLKCN